MQNQWILSGEFSTGKAMFCLRDALTGKIVEGPFVFDISQYFGTGCRLTPGCGYREEGRGAVGFPPQMVGGVLELLMANCGLVLGNYVRDVAAVCFSTQQHAMGGLTLDPQAALTQVLSHPERYLADTVGGLFATKRITSWRDQSSKPDAETMQQSILPATWAAITGSAPGRSLRFLGPQACALYRLEEIIYQHVGQFAILPSILAMLLTGKLVGVGKDEASCTCAMGLESCVWAREPLKAVYPPGFFDRLSPIVEVGADVGTLAQYWVQKYGFNSACCVILGMGDNPAAALTMGLRPGRWGVSLGTSETAYELVEPCFDPDFLCHVLRFALGCMAMDCTLHCGDFANGVRRTAKLSWDQFHDWIGRAPRTNEQCKWVIPGADGKPRYVGVSKDDPGVAGATLRAILYGIKRRFLRPFGGRKPPEEIVLTGGMAHTHVPRIVASIFGCPVIVAPDVNRVELGSAVMAAHRLTGRPLPEVVDQFCQVGERVLPDPTLADFLQKCDAAYDGAYREAMAA